VVSGKKQTGFLILMADVLGLFTFRVITNRKDPPMRILLFCFLLGVVNTFVSTGQHWSEAIPNEGYDSETYPWTYRMHFDSDDSLITWREGLTTRFTTLPKALMIHVRLGEEGMPAAIVILTNTDGDTVLFANTDFDGNLSVDSIQEGDYHLEILSFGSRDFHREVHLKPQQVLTATLSKDMSPTDIFIIYSKQKLTEQKQDEIAKCLLEEPRCQKGEGYFIMMEI
jgi:hypothetical protein